MRSAKELVAGLRLRIASGAGLAGSIEFYSEADAAFDKEAADYIERTAAPADGLPEFETTAEERRRVLDVLPRGSCQSLACRLVRDLDKTVAFIAVVQTALAETAVKYAQADSALAAANELAASEAKRADAWKGVAERAGICMTCALGAPDTFGCSDCLNTGWAFGEPLGYVVGAKAISNGHYAMPIEDVNNLDAVVHALGIEDSATTPAEAVVALIAERDREAAARQEADAAVKILRGVIEKERTFAADIIIRIERVIDSYWWLIESRGPYEYDDDRWRGEFKSVAGKLRSEAEKLRQQVADWSNCPTDPAEIAEARIDWKTRAEQAEAQVATLRSAREAIDADVKALRAAASRGPVSSREIFNLTDPIADKFARAALANASTGGGS